MRLIIFDMDGTLIDSVALIVETMTAAFEAVGEPAPTAAAIRSVSGITAKDALAILTPGADEARVLRLTDSYRNQYRSRAGRAREALFDGALATLERLRHAPDTILAVATGKGHSSAVALLNEHGIRDWFNSVETPTHNRGKPDPQMIETAMAKTGASKSETVMIGDTVHDIRMAKAARVKAIGVAWGYHSVVELEAAGADMIVERFEALEGTITKLLGV
jgi:phosphoglycolate phosphatase